MNAGPVGAAPLHMTIGTFIAFDAGVFTMAEEIRLAKVALLYADEALLLSPGVSMATQFPDPEELGTREEREGWVVDALAARVVQNPEGPLAVALHQAGAPDLRTTVLRAHPDRHLAVSEVREGLARFIRYRVTDATLESLIHELWEFPREAGIYELREAVEAGVLSVHGFEVDENMGWLDPSEEVRDRRIAAFTDLVSESVLDGSTHPLFDDQTGALAASLVRGGTIDPSESRLRLGRQSGLAADLFERLPTFEDADVGRVLEVRRELSAHLSGFRGAVAGFARETRGAVWDEDFPMEAEQMFVERVAPEVEKIERAVEADSSLRSLASKALHPSEQTSGVGLSAGLMNLTAVPDVLAMGLGLLGALGATVKNAAKERATERERLEGNRMFFYVAARDRLGQP